MSTWIKLHRKITEWEWYSDINACRVFIHLLIKANRFPGKWKGIDIERGQFITGRTSLSSETSLTEQQIRTALKKLHSTGEISIKSTSKFSIITICNYDNYQDAKCTEQPTDNQQVTSNQPASNQQVTTNKKYKKERKKEEKDFCADPQKDEVQAPKSISKKFIIPSQEEVQKYCLERKNNIDPEAFISHYNSNGWKVGNNPMRCWKSAVITWEKNENNRKPSAGKPIKSNLSPRQQYMQDVGILLENVNAITNDGCPGGSGENVESLPGIRTQRHYRF